MPDVSRKTKVTRDVGSLKSILNSKYLKYGQPGELIFCLKLVFIIFSHRTVMVELREMQSTVITNILFMIIPKIFKLFPKKKIKFLFFTFKIVLHTQTIQYVYNCIWNIH